MSRAYQPCAASSRNVSTSCAVQSESYWFMLERRRCIRIVHIKPAGRCEMRNPGRVLTHHQLLRLETACPLEHAGCGIIDTLIAVAAVIPILALPTGRTAERSGKMRLPRIGTRAHLGHCVRRRADVVSQRRRVWI